MPEVTMPADHPYQYGVDIAGQKAKPGVPITVDAETADSLAEQGWTVAGEKPPSVDDVLASVGDDPAAAAVELAAEQARPKPRKTLVAKLAAIAETLPASAGDTAPVGADTKEP